MTNKEIAKAWFAGIDSNKFEEVKKLMDIKHQFNNPMTPAPVGVDQHIGMMQMMTSAFKGQHNLDLILEDGDYVVVKGHWRGKHTDVFNGVAATGKEVEFSWIDIFQIINSKVVNEYFEMNPMSIMAQISEMPVS